MRGKFPEDYVAEILRFGKPFQAHGSSDMPVWGPIFGARDKFNEVAVRQRIKNLCEYLKTLQEKDRNGASSVGGTTHPFCYLRGFLHSFISSFRLRACFLVGGQRRRDRCHLQEEDFPAILGQENGTHAVHPDSLFAC